jgi:signal transduction histidine kinase
VIGGARRTLEFREVPVASGTLGFATDVTAQVAAATALRRQIEANEAMLDRLHRAVAVFSKDLTLSYFNESIANLWGLESTWLHTNPSLREILGALRERSKVPQSRNFATWRTETLDRFAKLNDAYETHWHLPNGGVLHLIAQPHPLGGMLLMFEDVTDRFEMRREVATVSAVQKAALSRLREGVLVLGLDGRRRLSNAAFETLWNLDESMLDDMHIREISTLCEPLYGDERVWSRMAEFVSGATEARGTWHERLYRKDGSVLGMAGTVLPDGATMFAFTDISDSIDKERALREQNEKLEELSGLKSAFLDGIHGASQELKIPLNTIIGFSEILGQEIFGDLNERQREYIDGVSTAANDLRTLVSGITDLAMIQADDFPFRVEPIHLKSVIEATVRFIERSVAEPVSLRVDCPEDIGEVPGDAPRFREIMHNLVNAVRSDTGGDEFIEIGVRRVDDWLMLWIGSETAELSGSIWKTLEDSLHGLDAPPLHRDALGVTLVKQFVERQGGTVSLERDVGGTRESVVCRFLTDETLVRAALDRQRPRGTGGRSVPAEWEDADSASLA